MANKIKVKKVENDKQSLPQSGNLKVEDGETEALKSQLARALADYDNLRRRTDEEKTLWIKFSSQTIITKLLTILDMLEKAQEHLKDQGLAIATLEFKKVLNEEGVEEITPKVGDEFNHELEEVIETVEGGESGKIAEVLVAGWKYKDGQVLRFAKVKVYN
ncbi:MAG TPA: nucleotide exchange factor GrpE [Patescibacteria group bacterium]|nr:nucleotide exchange factor GrpE [Patescibacteria group bacterium]